MDVLACIWNQIRRAFREQILPFVGLIILFGFIAALVVLLVALDPEFALVTLALVLSGALIVLVTMGALAIITAIINCVIAAIDRGIADLTGASPAAGQALVAVDCPSAQAALAQTEMAFNMALAARDATRTRAELARRRANTASQFLMAALLAITAVPFFRPDLLIAAIATAAAATLVLARRLRQLALAEAQLQVAEAALVAAAAQLGAAQALVDQLCGQGGQPPIGTVGLGAVDGRLGVAT